MKKWHKWALAIAGICVAAVIIIGALYWSSVGILSGTQELSERPEAIPKPAARSLEPLAEGEADWVSWLGTKGDGRSSVTGIISDWSGGLKKRWQVDFLCQGSSSAAWSAPVIQGNRLIVTGRSTESDLVFCLNPADGSLLWQASYSAKADAAHGAGPRATPVIVQDRVYTFGRSGDLVCWSLFDGRELWRVNVADEGGKEPTWGYASSPLIVGAHIIVQAGGSAGTIAYDRMTGNVAWKSGEAMAGYAALTRMVVAGRPLLLAFHGKGLAALHEDNGEVLWNLPWETPYDVNATTPVIIGESVFITSGYGTGGTLLKVGLSEAETVWKNKAIASHHSDPYAIDGYLYGYSGDSYQNKGSFKCVSVATGAETWATNKMGWGTCVFVDGYLLCCDIEGNLSLMRPNPERFVKVAEMRSALGDIEGPVWTRPVVANGLLYLRCKQRLVCYNLL